MSSSTRIGFLGDYLNKGPQTRVYTTKGLLSHNSPGSVQDHGVTDSWLRAVREGGFQFLLGLQTCCLLPISSYSLTSVCLCPHLPLYRVTSNTGSAPAPNDLISTWLSLWPSLLIRSHLEILRLRLQWMNSIQHSEDDVLREIFNSAIQFSKSLLSTQCGLGSIIKLVTIFLSLWKNLSLFLLFFLLSFIRFLECALSFTFWDDHLI